MYKETDPLAGQRFPFGTDGSVLGAGISTGASKGISSLFKRSIPASSLTVLISASQALSQARDMARVMEIVRYVARRIVGADGATFVLLDHTANGPMCHYADEDAIDPLWKGQRFPASACISGWAMQHKRTAIVPDIRTDERVPTELYTKTFVRSMVLVPIRTSDPVGAIGVYWRTTHKATEEEVYLLEALADMAAVTIELVNSYAELEHRVELRTTELHRQNAELRDNIVYAERVQRVMLPTREQMESALGEHFIIFRPKAVVSGDFYWLQEKDGVVYIAVADCTGHGVAGALLSIVCKNILDRVMHEFDRTEPGRMLDQARELLWELFSRNEQMSDGMDIALCAIDRASGQVEWSGANSDLWIVRRGEIDVLKAHREPVGRTRTRTHFPTHVLHLEPGDLIYLKSDGYVDQFGGPRGKKYQPRAMQQLVLSVHPLPMEQQRELLEFAFDEWRDNHEQVDDVTLLGIRI